MQHSALRCRTTPAVMRHRVEAAKSSAAPRPPFPSTAQTVTGLSEPFFVSPPQPVVPFVAFANASQQLLSAPPLPLLSRHSATIHSAAAPPGACGANGHDRKQRHVTHPSRIRREVPPEKGGHRTKTHPLFRDFSQLFSSKSPCTAQCAPTTPTISPPHSVFAGENTVRSHVFCLQICIFAHSSLSLRPYMSAKLRTLRRQVALAWILLLALLPQLVVKTFHYHDSAVPTEHIGLNAGGQGAECLACLRATAAGTPAPALAHRTHRPCHRHHHLPGQSARRQARQLQHLPFRARPLHRSHAASILLFRFHRGNTLSFRSTLDRSHGDCSRSAARPTDRLIFSPRFFFFFSSASAHSIE